MHVRLSSLQLILLSVTCNQIQMDSTDFENISPSEENILANSIKIARQRITSKHDSSLTTHQDQHSYPNSADTYPYHHSASRGKKDPAPAAQAIKALQERISQLEAFNSSLTKENSQSKKQISLKQRELETVKDQLQVSQIRLEEIQKKYKITLERISKVEASLLEKEEELRKRDDFVSKNSNQQAATAEQAIKVQKMLEEKVNELNKRIDNNQKIIVELIKDLEDQKQKNAEGRTKIDFSSPSTNEPIQKNSKSKSRETISFPVIVDEASEEDEGILNSRKKSLGRNRLRGQQFVKNSVQFHESTTFAASHSRHQSRSQRKKLKVSIDAEAKALSQKNQQLFQMLKNCERKVREEEKLKNEFKNKFYSLKSANQALIQEINKLPQNFHHKFKCLIVRVNKISGAHLECLRSQFNNSKSQYSRSRPSRVSSNASSNGSRRKNKPLKMEDLNISPHHSRYSNSHSKEKLRLSRDLGASHSASKERRGNQGIDRMLSRKIQEKQKLILQIHKKLVNEDSEEKRELLYQNLDLAIEQNSELQAELTKYRPKKS